MRKKIIIGKPYITEGKSDLFGTSAKLCAEIQIENPLTHQKVKKVCYFETEVKYKKYLCDERSDAFITALLSSAMENNYDIEFTAPMSARLYYGLTTYYIPIVSKHNAKFPLHNISLLGPTDSTPIKNKGAVVTGCSGGVDSFYTIARHQHGKVPAGMKLTHILYNSVGMPQKDEKVLRQIFKDTSKEMREIANDCKIDYVPFFNNIRDFYFYPTRALITVYTPIHASTTFALAKLFSICYASSGASIDCFSLDLSQKHVISASHFDIFTLSCLDNENIKFYSTGMECDRVDKEKFIANFVPSQRHLTICANQMLLNDSEKTHSNCSFCPKCLRTMCGFYSTKALHRYSAVFDVENFEQHKILRIAKAIGQNDHFFIKDIEREAKLNHIHLPIISYILGYLWYKPFLFTYKKLRTNQSLKKIYYKLNLDYKVHGHRGDYRDDSQQS